MIDTFFTILRKVVFAIVAVVFVFTLTYVPQIHTDESGHQYAANVEYAYGGGSAALIPIQIANLVETVFTAVKAAADFVIQTWLHLKESVLDGLTWLLGEEMLADMTADIVDWANSGFDGSPAFIENLDDFLLEHADRRIGEFINNLGGIGSFVCDPFRPNVQLSVALHWDYEREYSTPECTVTEIFDTMDDFEDFIAGDFRRGGWEGWFEVTSNPQNTPYGSVLTAQRQAMQAAAREKEEESKKTDWSQGHKSIENCEDIPGPFGDKEVCNIVTPGFLQADSLAKAVGTGQDRVVEADEFNEAFGLLLAGLSGEIFSGGDAGLLGLSGGTGDAYSGYSRGSFVDDLRDGVVDGSGSGGATDVGDAGDLGGTEGDFGRDFMADSMRYVSDTLDEVDRYIDDLNAFIASQDPTATTTLVAQIAVDEAEELRERMEDDLLEAAPLLAAYDALIDDYNATTDPDEQSRIRAEQAQLVQQFSRIGMLTEAEFEIYADQWDEILDSADFDPIDCSVTPFAVGCPCEIDISDPDCDFDLRDIL